MLKAIINFNQRNAWWSNLKNLSLRYRQACNKAIVATATILGLHFSTAQAQTFAPVQVNPWGLDTTSGIVFPHFCDIDNDGDLDMFTNTLYNGDLRFFENTGSATAPAFGASVLNPFGYTVPSNDPFAVTFADMDGDSDLDLLQNVYANVAAGTSTFRYLANVGTPSAPQFSVVNTHPFTTIFPSLLASINTADMDNDNDLDILVSYDNGGQEMAVGYLQNIGTDTAAVLGSLTAAPWGVDSTGYGSLLYTADLDNDTDLDILMGTWSNDISAANFNYYQNTGTSTAPQFASMVSNPSGLGSLSGVVTLAPNVVDIDGDTDLDVIVGGSDTTTSIYFFENRTIQTKLATISTLQWNVHLMPNPASEYLVVQIEVPTTQARLELSIINLSGTIIHSYPIQLENTNSVIVKLTLEDLAAGMYQLRLSNGKTQLSKQFVKS